MIHLMARKALGLMLSEQEESELTAWLGASDENRRIFEQVKTFQDADKMLRLERDGYARQMAKRVMRQLAVNGQRRVRHDLWKWMGGVAAAVAIIVCAVVWSLPEAEELPFARQEGQIVPGKVEAVLTFANGEKLHITDTTSEEVWKERLLVVDSACEGKAFVEEGQAVTYNVLAVPAGGEFFYVLPDSTRVWINSDSELRFPTNFVDGVRRVELRGEAFFDVAHDRRSPFVVTLSGGDITVYGTRFNVTDYKETGLSAVLVEGSIGFRSLHGDTVRLTPSERMVYGGDETGISVEKVDTELYTAWIDHRFVFRGQTLEEIMSTLARWYDFDIVFADEEARTIRLSGRLNRYDDIRVLLRTYEEVAGVHFGIRGQEIVVSLK